MAEGEVSARIRPKGVGGGVLFRATAGDASYSAIALLLTADPPKARLLTFNGKGKAFEVLPDASLPEMPPSGYAVSLGVAGSTVTARVDSKTITGTLGREVPEGKVGLAALAGGRIEVSDFKSRPCTAAPTKDGRSGRPGCARPSAAKGDR
jgi:hypothetical protein